MHLNELRKLWKQVPFEPFDIVLFDGRVFSVPHPDFFLVPPGRGVWVVVAHGDGTTERVNATLIGSLRPMKNGRRRKAG